MPSFARWQYGTVAYCNCDISDAATRHGHRDWTRSDQGRNFGLKSGGTKLEAPKAPMDRDAEGVEISRDEE